MHQVPSIGEAERSGKQPAILAGFAICAGITIFGYFGFTAYEGYVLGHPFFPYEPVFFTPYYVARSAFALVASGLIVWSIGREWDGSITLNRDELRRTERVASLAIMTVALAFIWVFLASPGAFEQFAAEDTPLEWASAIFALVGSCLVAADFLRRLRHSRSGDWRSMLGLGIAGSLAILFFLIGMEEISWMQRVLDFETPAAMAEANWQSEFNLHNFQTYLAETAYYSGAAFFLVLLPLIGEAAPKWPLLRLVSDFVPGRFAVAASAPIAIFNYGHWNIIPIQITTMITVFVLLVYANAVVGGQSVFLAFGSSMSHIPNTEEFKEFFIALGIACFALEACRRSRRRADQVTQEAHSGLHLAAGRAVR